MKKGQLLTAWCMHAHAVGVYSTPAPATPHVAIAIAANAVREASLKPANTFPPLTAVPSFTTSMTMLWIVRSIRCTSVDDVDLAEIGREADTIRSTYRSFSDYRGLAGLAIDAINPDGQFEFSFVRPS